MHHAKGSLIPILSGLAHRHVVPPTVKTLTWATGVRWAGWGFGELLIPVMLFAFSESYAETGLLKSAWDIGYILMLPVAGVLADKMSGIVLVILALIVYPFVGVGYWIAGLTSLAIFIVIARFLNGVSWAMDSVGRETYFRHHVAKEKIPRAFGYFDTVANLCWITAAVAGIFLLRWIPVHWLLFIIAPTSVIALLMVMHIRHKSLVVSERSVVHAVSWRTYREILREFMKWDLRLRMLAALKVFSAIANALGSFFIPIVAYAGGQSLSSAVLIGILFSVPSLFGLPLGNVVANKKSWLIASSLILLAGGIGLLAVTDVFAWQLAVALFIGLMLELLSLTTNGVISASVPPEHFGRVASIMGTMTDLGNLATPILLGVAIDALGVSPTFTIVAVLFGMLAVVFFSLRKRYDGDLIKPHIAV